MDVNHFDYQYVDNIIRKENLENNKIYNFDIKESEKILIKKIFNYSSGENLSIFKEINELKYGFEILKTPKHFTFYLGIIYKNDEIINNDVSKMKFFIKAIDTYGNKIYDTENNNLLNLKGLNIRFYLPNCDKKDEVSLFLNKGYNLDFKNKMNYNEELNCFDVNYKGMLGNFEIKAYRYEIEKKIKSTFTESNTIWIVCLSILGGLVVILIFYLFYYFFFRVEGTPFDGHGNLMGSYPSREEFMETVYRSKPLVPMTPIYAPEKISDISPRQPWSQTLRNIPQNLRSAYQQLKPKSR